MNTQINEQDMRIVEAREWGFDVTGGLFDMSCPRCGGIWTGISVEQVALVEKIHPPVCPRSKT